MKRLSVGPIVTQELESHDQITAPRTTKRFRITLPSWSALLSSTILIQFSDRANPPPGTKLWHALLPDDPRLRGEFWSDWLPQFLGSFMGLLSMGVVISLVGYWLFRRSQRAATIALCASASLTTLGGTAEQDKWLASLGVLSAALLTAICVRSLRPAESLK